MEINLTQLTSGSKVQIDFDCSLSPDDNQVKEARLIAWGPIVAHGKIYLVDKDFYCYLELNYNYTKSCDRCLEPMSQMVSYQATILLKDKALADSYDATETDRTDIDVGFYQNYFYNPEQDIFDYAYLALPQKSVCDSECKGICSNCGCNLNTETCDCADEVIDPRLEVLKGLLD
ncbi:MAG: DUF177 domain-containing protein [Tissierellia bacterium]|nr:DUF177 domain-containing protein [Tissierellia bacterium]